MNAPGRFKGYHRFPLAYDQARSTTVLAFSGPSAAQGAGGGEGVLVHLHTAVDLEPVALTRPHHASRPLYRVTDTPKLTLELPADDPDLTGPERVLAEVGALLWDLAYGDGHIYPWLLGGRVVGPLTHDAWLSHLRQLADAHGRLRTARGSPVAADPRVRARMTEVAETAELHADVLRRWLGAAGEAAPGARAQALEELHERQVEVVLDALAGGAPERRDARTNPHLPRIADGPVRDARPRDRRGW